MTQTIFRVQPKQELFLRSNADITIFGGSAGGGKTAALLFEPLYHKHVQGFEAVIFRRTIADITRSGGLWDESRKILPVSRWRSECIAAFLDFQRRKSHVWRFAI